MAVSARVAADELIGFLLPGREIPWGDEEVDADGSDKEESQKEEGGDMKNALEVGRARDILYRLLIQHSTALPPRLADLCTAALETQDREMMRERALQKAGEIAPRLRPDVCVWRGDICDLEVDAVTNACNGALLGCFQPGHRCIDNAIHARAGPWMRMACHALRVLDRDDVGEAEVRSFFSKHKSANEGEDDDKGDDGADDESVVGVSYDEHYLRATKRFERFDEPPGRARVTPSYNLPSRFCVQTVGPIVRPGTRPSKEDEQALAGCYRSVLDACARVGARSVALCGISTGIFGYPEREAAVVALETVRAWLDADAGEHIDLVVFNTFTEASHALYTHLAPRVFANGEHGEEDGEEQGGDGHSEQRERVDSKDTSVVVGDADSAAEGEATAPTPETEG
jgi:O-acetyl-ADP-ribose deacetylase (regulator of RNase III)